jgi:hypothetical protein
MSVDQSQPGDTLPFLVAGDLDETGEFGDKGIFGRSSESRVLREIPVAVLQHNLQSLMKGLRRLFDEISAQEGDLPLRQAQVTFEVSATGGIALVGNTLQSSAKGAITLTFGS